MIAISDEQQSNFDKLNKKLAGRSNFSEGYAGTTASNNRAAISRSLTSVDQDLKKREKDEATTRLRSHQKNYSVAAWAVRTHLNHIAEQNLAFSTGDQGLNSELEALFAELMRPENCDARGKHGLIDFARLFESHAVVEGDVFAQKLQDGKINAIESDRVRDPNKVEKFQDQKWINGVQVDSVGKIQRINITKRGKVKNQFEDIGSLRIESLFHHGYFQRFDQIRGVSPMMSALNDFQDVYENKSFALAKAKLAQMFGIAIFRGDVNDDEEELPNPANGAVLLELSQNDDAKILQDSNPSDQWQNFMDTVVSMAIKSLDLPFSMYREDFTNFFGSRSARQTYDRASISKQRNLRNRFLNPWTEWQLRRLAVRDYPQFRNELPKFSWNPLGTAWANPIQEVTAAALEVGLGFRTRGDVIEKVHGKTFKDTMDKKAEEERYMRDELGMDPAIPNSLQLLQVAQMGNESE